MREYQRPILDIVVLTTDDVLLASGFSIENENVFDGPGENV